MLYLSEGLPRRPGEELYQHLLDLFGNDVPQQAGSLSELLRLADHRMYRAKAQGRDSVFGEA